MTSVVGRIHEDYEEYKHLCKKHRVKPWRDHELLRSFYTHWEELKKKGGTQK